MEQLECEALRTHLTGLLKALNPDIRHVAYQCDYAFDRRTKELKTAVLSFGDGHARTVELAGEDARSAVITLVASCFPGSGGGRMARGRR